MSGSDPRVVADLEALEGEGEGEGVGEGSAASIYAPWKTTGHEVLVLLNDIQGLDFPHCLALPLSSKDRREEVALMKTAFWLAVKVLERVVGAATVDAWNQELPRAALQLH